MVLSNYFETLEEIRIRSGEPAEKVIEEVRNGMRESRIVGRTEIIDGREVTKFGPRTCIHGPLK